MAETGHSTLVLQCFESKHWPFQRSGIRRSGKKAG